MDADISNKTITITIELKRVKTKAIGVLEEGKSPNIYWKGGENFEGYSYWWWMVWLHCSNHGKESWCRSSII
ncbi:hypothetical protein LGK95_07110 [Clostridium algoriphilum]|uniref:hypothetical protein n=1 Tax=Clostridium algoriphilum TaxID=198347 RepID=UPI001CF45580|nr:hypothetical protein [Clostridium algoriphilum]MCB2293287.1 hypothetical protein [Clostridium algoriphilum]